MELNAEQIKKDMEHCINDDCDKCNVPFGNCQANLIENALSLITLHEQRIEELTEENERLRGVGVPDNDVYIRLTDAKHAIMDYIGEQTVSKYASFAECKSARLGAEGAMNELDYLIPVKVAPIADTVRKMHSMLCEGRVSNDNVVIVANQIAKEMLEEG